MARPLRKAHGMREKSPGVWEMIVELPRDPVTGKRRQLSRTFRGGLRAAKAARAELLAEVSKGRHTGTNATLDELCQEWLIELTRKGRSPTTIDEYRRVYHHDIQPTLGKRPVNKVTTKMLTDLYGAHQKLGTGPASVVKMHATISSMMTQACKWGWRDTNPARWADPPPIPDTVPAVPTPEEVAKLLDAAHNSERPIYEKVFFITATTGIRRGELCALRRKDFDWQQGSVVIARGIVKKKDPTTDTQFWVEKPTKNRRRRTIELDARSLEMIQAEVNRLDHAASEAGVNLDDNPFIFTNSVTGSDHWIPDTITQYFGRLTARSELRHLSFKLLRKFMDTYGQELGFSLAQVSVRAGHDPAVASRHYTGRVPETDKAIAEAISDLLDNQQATDDH